MFIEGINIIEQIPIKESTPLSDALFVVGILIAIASFVCFLIMATKKDKVDKNMRKIVFICLFGLGVMFSSVIHIPCFYAETGKYTYKCTFENNISVNYIEDNFEILSIENGVWTLKEK